MDPLLESKLKKALAGRAAADMGQFEFLNLDMVRAEAGDRWIEVRKKIYSVSTYFVEKRLHADDVLLRCRGGFILIFARLTGAQSRERVAAISRELNLFFLGDQILKDLQIHAEAKSVSAAEFAQILQMTSQSHAEGEAAAKPSQAGWKNESGDAQNRPAGWTEGQDGTAGRAAGWKEGSDAAPPRAAGWKEGDDVNTASGVAGWKDEGSSRSGTPSTGANWQDGDEPVRRDRRDTGTAAAAETGRAPGKAGWREAVEDASETGDPRLPEAIFTESTSHWDDFVFKPFWDAKLGLVSANLCLARRVRNGVPVYGRDTLRGDASKSLHLELDRSVAVAAQRGFQQMFAHGATCAIAIPVHYDTVRNIHERVAYFSILQSVPQHLRRYFYLRIDGIPEGAPIGQMQEIFRSMKCFGSNLLAKIPLNMSNIKVFEGCRIDMFGSEVPGRLSNGNFNDADLEALANRAKACKELSAGSFLTQVSSFEILNVGISVGVRYFSGEAIGSETALPTPVVPLSFADLHARQQERLRRDQKRASA